jgi:hypothetical protein
VINLRGLEIVIVINRRVIVGDTIARYRCLQTRRQEQHDAPNQGECHNGSDFGIGFNIELGEHPKPFERVLPYHTRGARSNLHGLQGIHFYFQGTNVFAKFPAVSVICIAIRWHFSDLGNKTALVDGGYGVGREYLEGGMKMAASSNSAEAGSV